MTHLVSGLCGAVKGGALWINLETLGKLCGRLSCQPGDVLWVASAKKKK